MDYIRYIKHFKYNHKIDFINNTEIFFKQTGTLTTFKHCQDVANCAVNLSDKSDTQSLYISGLLHDISAFIPKNRRLEVSRSLSIPILAEEEEFPLLLHQKLSAYIAKECFEISDTQILNAIECHTTLKSDFTDLDITLFLADKIAWDQLGTPPYLYKLENKLAESKEAAALVYINYLLDNNIKVVHPWLRDAQNYLNKYLD